MTCANPGQSRTGTRMTCRPADSSRMLVYTRLMPDWDPIAASLRTFFASYSQPVAAVYVFGSAARGTAQDGSDLDVGVLFEAPPPPTLVGQPFDAADALERLLGRPVDVIALNTAPVDLRIRILRDGHLVFERDAAARVRFEVATRNEAFDLDPILRAYRAPRRAS
jgi:predicted nucleotidyltransferase